MNSVSSTNCSRPKKLLLVEAPGKIMSHEMALRSRLCPTHPLGTPAAGLRSWLCFWPPQGGALRAVEKTENMNLDCTEGFEHTSIHRLISLVLNGSNGSNGA